MRSLINPNLLDSDIAILENLLNEQDGGDDRTLEKLKRLEKESMVFSNKFSTRYLSYYVSWASKIVRNPVDVVFLTHILLYLVTSVPSAILLYVYNNRIHGILHWIMQATYCGPFTLMLHNHIHNNGLLKRRYAWFDHSWPVVLEPLMGHTWHSYYYHHVKHHHVENNGPEDLSSTIRYQRDELTHFLMYLGRFLFLIWYDLPVYFIRKHKYEYAWKAASNEISNYLVMVLLAKWRFEPTLWVFIIPFIQMRLGLMIGNFGQHALVDDVEPDSDFRTSITLIDVPSNRFCFNDGWHTSHHLNPLRHWREHPRAFLEAKSIYAANAALIFKDIDYLEMTYRILRKDYDHLAKRLVPIGEQKNMTRKEISDMLKTKTRRFTETEIQEKFYPHGVVTCKGRERE